MPNVISNMLVGIGFDIDQNSAKKASSSFDSMSSKALKMGSVVAGAFGAKALVFDFADAKDDLGKFSQVFGVTADDVNAFGLALGKEGGTLAAFMSQLSGLERMRAGLLQGDADFISKAAKARIDTKEFTQAEDTIGAYLALADQFRVMTTQQRINAAAALGLDNASIRLLSKGKAEILKVVADQKKMRGITKEATDAAAIFNDEMQDLKTNLGGFSDQVSLKVLPQINNVLTGLNDWIAVNRELENSGLNTFLGAVSENFIAISAGLGLLTAGAGFKALRALSKIPGKILGSKSNAKTEKPGKKTAEPKGKKSPEKSAKKQVKSPSEKIGKKPKTVEIKKPSKTAAGIGKKIPKIPKTLAKGAFKVFSKIAPPLLAIDAGLIIGDVVGKKINEELSVETKDVIGGTVDQALKNIQSGIDSVGSVFASDGEKTKPEQTKAQACCKTDVRPVVVTSNLILDGALIDKRVHKVVGDMANQTVQDLTTLEAG